MFSDHSRGRQCVANATAAIAYTAVKDIHEWKVADLDLLLFEGDHLYREITARRPHEEQGLLFIPDIPEEVELFAKQLIVHKMEPLCGLVSNNQLSEIAFTLSDAVARVFSQVSSGI